MRKDGEDIERDGCMRGKDEKLGIYEKGWKRIWKNRMKEILNKANNLDHMAEASKRRDPVIRLPVKKWR